MTPQQIDRAQVRYNLDGFKHRWYKRLDGWHAAGEKAIEKK
ncbi:MULTISPECIES: hypothetical protein [Corynebacterium]|nr:hypothetical protein [Corynebacterium pseudodiphtheriticum]MDK8718797.1 hypothetical protein [Corynebacterium pseudodiphtheriticum]